MYRLHDLARLANHFAAPEEPALAVLFDGDLRLGVTPPAAQKVAAPHAHRVRVALSPSSADGADLAVPLAEVWRLLGVDEVLVGGGLDGVGLRDEGLAVVGDDHLEGPLELVLESVPHVPEDRHLPPAGLERARARQSMALALPPHVAHHRLGTERTMGTFQEKRKKWMQVEMNLYVGWFDILYSQ